MRGKGLTYHCIEVITALNFGWSVAKFLVECI